MYLSFSEHELLKIWFETDQDLVSITMVSSGASALTEIAEYCRVSRQMTEKFCIVVSISAYPYC